MAHVRAWYRAVDTVRNRERRRKEREREGGRGRAGGREGGREGEGGRERGGENVWETSGSGYDDVVLLQLVLRHRCGLFRTLFPIRIKVLNQDNRMHVTTSPGSKDARSFTWWTHVTQNRSKRAIHPSTMASALAWSGSKRARYIRLCARMKELGGVRRILVGIIFIGRFILVMVRTRNEQINTAK
jgi:hypothetical protein